MKISKQSLFTFSLIALAAAAMVMMPGFALADDPIGRQLCDIAGWFKGPTGRGIATIAIVVLGIAAFFGKVTWGMALMFAIGIFAIFGSSEIIAAVSSGTGCE